MTGTPGNFSTGANAENPNGGLGQPQSAKQAAASELGDFDSLLSTSTMRQGPAPLDPKFTVSRSAPT
jgi:hypothetical protein